MGSVRDIPVKVVLKKLLRNKSSPRTRLTLFGTRPVTRKVIKPVK